MSELRSLHQFYEQSCAENYACALLTLVGTEGSTYRKAGAKMIVNERGEKIGLVAGGCFDSFLVEVATDVIRTRTPKLIAVDTREDDDALFGSGLGCQGKQSLYVEPLPQKYEQTKADAYIGAVINREDTCSVVLIDDPNSDALKLYIEPRRRTPSILIVGAGDDAIPVYQLFDNIGWAVTVVDSRSMMLSAERFPHAARITDAYDSSKHTWDAQLIMSHRFEVDREALAAALQSSCPYIGVLGPKHRTARLLAEITKKWCRTLTESENARIFSPCGLTLGATNPAGIAVSIVAEVMAFHSQQDVKHFRELSR